MTLTPAQQRITNDSSRFRVVCCGRRFGKTTLALYEMVGADLSRAGAKVAYLALNFGQARDIAWVELKRIVEPVLVEANESRLEITVLSKEGGKSTIYLKGWESVESLRGMAFDFLVLDEVASMRNFWESWEEVLRPTLTDRLGQVLFISTPKSFNHFHELFQKEQADTNYKSFHFTSYDNPHLDPAELDAARKELPEDRFAQEYMADFRRLEGLVWNIPRESVLDASDALVERLKAYPDRVVAGIDWGFEHPAAIVVLYVKEGAYLVADEWCQSGKSMAEIIEVAKDLKKKHGITMWFPDSARPDLIDEFKRASFSCGETSKDVVLGLSHVAGLVHQKRLFVVNSCSGLLNEMDRYQWEKGVDGRPHKERPIKIQDDLCDALRYALMGYRTNEPKRLTPVQRLMSPRLEHKPKQTYSFQ